MGALLTCHGAHCKVYLLMASHSDRGCAGVLLPLLRALDRALVERLLVRPQLLWLLGLLLLCLLALLGVGLPLVEILHKLAGDVGENPCSQHTLWGASQTKRGLSK